MKIVFFGTPEFARYSLEKIVESGCAEVAAVVTAPDKPAGRGHSLLQSAVKEYAVAHGLPVLQPVKLKDPEFVERLRSLGADLFVVIAFRMLPEVVWAMPRFGTFNLHASLLPRYRGAAPINWAVINGETRTGVTTFFIDRNIDTGSIIDQETVELLPTDCAGTLHDKLMELGARLTVKTIKQIAEQGTVATHPQPDGDFTPAPKLTAENTTLDFSRTALEMHNLVRGLSPYPAAHCQLAYEDGTLQNAKILETRVTDTPQGLCAKCGDGRWLQVLTLQPAGRRAMPARDFLNGLKQAVSLK